MYYTKLFLVTLDARYLLNRIMQHTSIHHKLGVATSIDHYTINPFGVTHHTALKHKNCDKHNNHKHY